MGTEPTGKVSIYEPEAESEIAEYAQTNVRLRERIRELEAVVREQGDMLHTYMVQRDDLRAKLNNALKAARARIKRMEELERERDAAKAAVKDLIDRREYGVS